MNMKGSLPLLILHTLSREAKHGYRIAKDIKQQSVGVLNFAEGTLYPTLHDLEKRGLIKSIEEEVKGRTRRSYHLTEKGQAQLAKERAEWERYSQAVNLILGNSISS